MDSESLQTDNESIEANMIDVLTECDMEECSADTVQSLMVNCESERVESERREKRSRELDEEEQWINVTRGGKKFIRSVASQRTGIPEDKIEVTMTGKEKIPKQIGLARILKAENLTGIVRIKYINPYKILIQFDSETNAGKLINCPYFIEKEYRFQKTFEVGSSYGVIKDIDLELSEEEVMKSLRCETEIVSIKRLKKRNYDDGNWEPSEAMRVCFTGPSLPQYLHVLDTRTEVEPYVFPVTQCSRCWKFGHSQRICPSSKITCPKCGGNHPNCEITSYKCVNCSGKHISLSKLCPVFIKERKLREIMAEFNCTYRKALTMYSPPSPPVEMNQRINKPTQLTVEAPPTQSNVYAPLLLDQPQCSPTYAEVVRTTAEAYTTDNTKGKRRSSKKKGKNRAEETLTGVVVSSDECSSEYEKENTSRKSPILKDLLEKIKDIIFIKTYSVEEKIQKSFKLLFDWTISLFIDLISEWPIINHFFKHNG
ncbi:unnamed protein product [Plutella xylostella]|uniref:(diamondback moth) hypothetical protein n=1 Tax=Plutella xylostella TaxID=51655 RepID=A0A8S4EF86_PLUXY|nr:unnamed protein product [Plutella xylostella]